MTQEGLAARSGISTRAISDLERGLVDRPQQRTIEALAAALGADGDALVALFRPPAPETPPPERFRDTAPAPRYQLPREAEDLTGRQHEIDRLSTLIEYRARAASQSTTVISIFGLPGVGKTTFATHLGHRLAEHFPGGRFFLDLRGLRPDQLSTDDAVHHLLLAFGVADHQIPAHADERLSLYQSLVWRQKILLVLDNVADDAQVRPLLASSPGSLVLITSRRVLSGLESVTRVMLGVLSPRDATRLLGSIIEPERVLTEPQAVRRVAELCGFLPLALRIAGNRLASRPGWRIETLVRQLSDQHRRLSALTAGDLGVRSAFAVSYHHLDHASKLVFRRLSLLAGTEVRAETVSVLTGLDEDEVEQRLEELVDASLLGSAEREGRYHLHDLMRLFAGELLAAEESAESANAAARRRDEWLLDKGIRAGRQLIPARDDGVPESRAPDSGEPVLAPADALEWLDTERPQWTVALRDAARRGEHERVLGFCHAMHWYADLHPNLELWPEVFTLGAAAAATLGRPLDEAMQLNFLGWAINRIQKRHHEALALHQRARALAAAAGDRAEEAWSLYYCGRCELDLSRLPEAILLLRQASEVFAAAGHLLGRHSALSFLGLALEANGAVTDALDAHRRSCAYFRTATSIIERNSLSVVLMRLATSLEKAGEHAEAAIAYGEAAEAAASTGSRRVECTAQFGRARCLYETEDIDGALTHLTTALDQSAEIGDDTVRDGILELADLVRARAEAASP